MNSSVVTIILIFGVLFSLLYFANNESGATTVLTKPSLSEDEAIEIMKSDLEPRVAPATIDRMFIYGRDLPAEMRQLPLIYFHQNNTQFYINSTNNYVIDGRCTPSTDFPCFVGKKVIESVRGHLAYLIDGGWTASDGRSSPMYYFIDARSGRILWSYVGEDVFPELRASQ